MWEKRKRGVITLVCGAFLVVLVCSEQVRFKRLEPLDRQRAHLYILRPYQDVLTWTRITLILRRFPGKFTEKNSVETGTFKIGDGEYVRMELAEGYYELEIKGEPVARKIVYLKNGDQGFFALRYRSRGSFSIPGVFIEKIENTDAVGELLKYDRMIQIPASIH